MTTVIIWPQNTRITGNHFTGCDNDIYSYKASVTFQNNIHRFHINYHNLHGYNRSGIEYLN
jgi:hypothetical protein